MSDISDIMRDIQLYQTFNTKELKEKWEKEFAPKCPFRFPSTKMDASEGDMDCIRAGPLTIQRRTCKHHLCPIY